MIIMNNVEIDTSAVITNLKRLTNQIYKLLPNREEGLDWQAPLNTIVEEIAGMNIIFRGYHPILLSLLSKLEGLKIYENEDGFYEYRRTIFECLNLMQVLRDSIKEQEDK